MLGKSALISWSARKSANCLSVVSKEICHFIWCITVINHCDVFFRSTHFDSSSKPNLVNVLVGHSKQIDVIIMNFEKHGKFADLKFDCVRLFFSLLLCPTTPAMKMRH